MSDRILAAGRSDEELVAEWLAPLSVGDLGEALADAGFSGNIYRDCFADLHSQLDDEAAGLLHFLRHGFAEERVFPVELDLAGLDRLRRLPIANRLYVRNLYTALVTAWLGVSVRSIAQLSTHAATVQRFRQSGGVPFLLVGGPALRLYRRGDWCGQRWLCPLAMDPIEGGLEALAGCRHETLLPVPGLFAEPLPVLWVFGHADLEWSWLAHRLREGIRPDNMDAAASWTQSRAQAYLAFLCRAVGTGDRAMHWLATVLPPVPASAGRADPPTVAVPPALQAEFGPAIQRLVQGERDSLLHRTLMADQFNQALLPAAREAGFNMLDCFDRLLSGQGMIDERFLSPQRESLLPDRQATRGILVTALWTMAASPRRAAEAPSMREQFEHLLRDIRAVQMG